MANTYPDAYSWYINLASITRASNGGQPGPKENWATELLYAVGEQSFWSRFIGETPNAIIQIKSEMFKPAGDYYHYNLINTLSEQPIDQTKETWGSEEVPSTYGDTVQACLIRHACKMPEPMPRLQSPYNLRKELFNLQEIWWREMFDKLITYKLSGKRFLDSGDNVLGEAGTPQTNVLYGGSAQSQAQIDSTCGMTTDLLSKAKVMAYTGIQDSAGNTIWKMRPIRTDGGDYYVAVLHPYQVYALKNNEGSKWSEAQLLAGTRGPDNLIFRGTGEMAGMLPKPVGIWDDVLIYVSNHIILETTWGAGGNVPGAYGLFLGAQAGLLGWSYGPEWIEEEYLYHDYNGVAVKVVLGMDKATFNSKDFAVIGLQTYAEHPNVVVS